MYTLFFVYFTYVFYLYFSRIFLLQITLTSFALIRSHDLIRKYFYDALYTIQQTKMYFMLKNVSESTFQNIETNFSKYSTYIS